MKKDIFIAFMFAMLAGFCLLVSPVGAVDQSEDVINYAYSNWIGSGFYKIDDRTVYMLRAPFSYTLKEADSENWGMALLFPATIGFHNFSEGEDNQATFTFVPGVRFDFPVLDNWWLKKTIKISRGCINSGLPSAARINFRFWEYSI
jgi:hypothetical protein